MGKRSLVEKPSVNICQQIVFGDDEFNLVAYDNGPTAYRFAFSLRGMGHGSWFTGPVFPVTDGPTAGGLKLF